MDDAAWRVVWVGMCVRARAGARARGCLYACVRVCDVVCRLQSSALPLCFGRLVPMVAAWDVRGGRGRAAWYTPACPTLSSSIGICDYV